MPTPPSSRSTRGEALSIGEASRGLVSFRMFVDPREVVFIKGVLEASDGVAALFAESGGDLQIAAPLEQVAELRRILADLADETGGRVIEPA